MCDLTSADLVVQGNRFHRPNCYRVVRALAKPLSGLQFREDAQMAARIYNWRPCRNCRPLAALPSRPTAEAVS